MTQETIAALIEGGSANQMLAHCLSDAFPTQYTTMPRPGDRTGHCRSEGITGGTPPLTAHWPPAQALTPKDHTQVVRRHLDHPVEPQAVALRFLDDRFQVTHAP